MEYLKILEFLCCIGLFIIIPFDIAFGAPIILLINYIAIIFIFMIK